MIVPINTIANPEQLRILKRPAVKGQVAEASKLSINLLDTASSLADCVGLASTQIWNTFERETPHVFIVKLDTGWKTFIDATSKRSGFYLKSKEGCMSKPGYTGVKKRHSRIAIQYFDENGVEHFSEYLGFNAIMIQHELDHLTGALI
jgi:peptide deformylase